MIPNIYLTEKQADRFEYQLAYARKHGIMLYNAAAPTEAKDGYGALLDGEDDNAEDQALVAAGLFRRDDGYYTYTQKGWDLARWMKS